MHDELQNTCNIEVILRSLIVIKLMLVDDEPLVLAKLKSMLPWEAYGIEICGALPENSGKTNRGGFEFSRYKKTLEYAFKKGDSAALEETINHILAELRLQPGDIGASMEVACNLLFMTLYLLHDGEFLLSKIFSFETQEYGDIYRLQTHESILSWI